MQNQWPYMNKLCVSLILENLYAGESAMKLLLSVINCIFEAINNKLLRQECWPVQGSYKPDTGEITKLRRMVQDKGHFFVAQLPAQMIS